MKYGLHKLWFTYTDEWYVTNDKLATQIGMYSSLEEARIAKAKAEIESLKNMRSDDYIRDLTGFMEKNNCAEKIKQLVEFARSEGWQDSLREQKFFNSENTYFELSIPQDATDEQLAKIIEISGAYFCKIIEYKNVRKSAYIKFNHGFWGTKIFKLMKDEGIIEDRSPFINGEKNKGKYFVQKPPKGRKSATIRDIESGLEKVIELTLKYITQYPEFSFIGKTYIDDISTSPITLQAYIDTCKNISIQEEIVDSSNLKAITSKLKKLKSTRTLQVGDTFNSLVFAEEELAVKELQGFFNLLTIKPYSVFVFYTEINGESVNGYYPDFHTF